MNNLGWSRREQPANTNPQNPLLGTLQKLNPFSTEGNVRLPTTESGDGPGAPLPARTRREEEEGWFARKSALSATSTVHRHHHHAHYCSFRVSARAVPCFLDMLARLIRVAWCA